MSANLMQLNAFKKAPLLNGFRGDKGGWPKMKRITLSSDKCGKWRWIQTEWMHPLTIYGENKAIIVFRCNWMTSLRGPYFIRQLEIEANALCVDKFSASVSCRCGALPFNSSKRNNMFWIWQTLSRFKWTGANVKTPAKTARSRSTEKESERELSRALYAFYKQLHL